MKKKVWLNPNGMKFESGYKSFDRYIRSVSPENCLGTGQRSSYIRPYTELECNGQVNDPGHLRDYDLNSFMFRRLPYDVRQYVLSVTKKKGCILYEFYFRRHKKETVIGYVVTTTDHKLLKIINTRDSEKAGMALMECAKYITEAG